MKPNRREIMQGGAALVFLASVRAANAAFAPKPTGWRRFEITTRVVLPTGGAGGKAWVPVPSVNEPGWNMSEGTEWTSTASHTEQGVDPVSGASFVMAEWSASEGEAVLEVVSVVATQNRATDFAAAGAATLSAEDRAYYTAATELLPTDGIVRATAEEIVAGAASDLDKAQAIYDWVVVNTERNPETRGCGFGDIASMLETGDLTGKCADLNALYVGLARAAGLPARDVYGIRVAPSAFGYKSLGAGSADITKAQHCRAEVFLDGFGWTPVDPADVRKVVLEEPPKTLKLGDPEVEDVRAALFGAWEGNWIAYNFAHDVTLPGATQGTLPYLMYPQAEIGGVAVDPLDPPNFAYTIIVRELSA